MFFGAACGNCRHTGFVPFEQLVQDGYSDVPYNQVMRKSGEAYLVFGSHLATKPGTVDLDDLSGGKGVRLDGIDLGDRMSWGLSSAGDINGDCRDDILIGAYQADPNGDKSGETYLISGHTLDLAADGTGVATAGVIDLAAGLGLG